MFWFIAIVVIVVIVGVKIRTAMNAVNSAGSPSYSKTTGQYTSPVSQAAWREPITPDEHFVLLSIMADALSAFGMGVSPSGLSEVNMTVTYNFAPHEPDRVTMTLYGVSATTVFQQCQAWKYLKRCSADDGFSVSWKFDFPSGEGGAPFYYRDEEDVISFVRQFAPTVYSCPRNKTNDDAWLCFRKEGSRRRAENLDAEIVNAYNTYQKY